MELFLVRHPQTIRNVEDRLSGWERCDYSDLGNVQFGKIVEYFSDNDKVVYSSDLPRAEILAEKISENSGSELIVDEKLRELNFKETAPHDSFETPEDLAARISTFLEGVSKNAVIVSHAGTTNVIAKILCGESCLSKMKNQPRDVIFKIETIKNENKLSVIQT